MQRFTCEHCGAEIRFESFVCPVCGSLLGYVPAERTVRQLHPAGDDVSYAVNGVTAEQWRCANAAWGCNWVLAAGAGTGWCRSCARPGRSC